MAASLTSRVTLTNGGDSWTKIHDGTSNGLFVFIQHDQGPAVELFYGPTGSAPVKASEGFMLYPRGTHGGGADSAISLGVLAADSIWARSSTTDTSTKINVMARAT